MNRAWAWMFCVGFVLAGLFLASSAQFDRGRGEVVLPLVVTVSTICVLGLVSSVVLALAETSSRIRGAKVSVALATVGLLVSGLALLFASYAQF